MKKLYIQNLVLVITEKCNFNCRHCIRGNGYNINMSDSMFNQIFSEVKGINNLIISGGEPLLEKDRLLSLLNSLKENGVVLEQYGLTTNGTLYDEEIESIFDQYEAYVSSVALNDSSRINEKYHGYIDLSEDEFHHEEIMKNEKLRQNYFDNISKLKQSKYFYGIKTLNNGIIQNGNALKLGSEYRLVKSRQPKIFNYQDSEFNYIGPVISISPNGNIISYNNSYEEMENVNYGNVQNGIFDEIKGNSKKCISYQQFFIKSDYEIFKQKYKSL